jgi:ATP-dependent Clp protease protease subunit
MRVVNQYHVPGIFEQTNRGERGYDLFSRMREENIVFMGTPIDDYVANAVCAQLLYLEYKNPDKDISIYINSPGGDITALFAVYDTMKFVRNDISTFCYGQAASAAAVILAGGTKGKRCRTAVSCCTSPTVGPPGRRPTSRSRPRRSSGCGTCSTR